MAPSDVVKLFRGEVADAVTPYLWSTEEVWSYLVDAQTMFTRKAYGLRDMSSAAARIALSEGGPTAPLHPSVLKIHSARLESTKRPISILSFADVYMVQNVHRHLPFAFSQIDAPGNVCALITDVEDGLVKVVHVPTADDAVLLIVDRMPLTAPSEDNDRLEIREEHHRHLTLWMRHLAYSKHDADTFDPNKADTFGAQFLAYCDVAAEEKRRREDKPRLIQYGGL